MSAVLSISDASKIYRSAGVEFQLSMERFEIRAGELIGLIGPSGCGKSSLLEILALISRPDTAQSFTLRPGVPGAGSTVDLAALWSSGQFDELAKIRRRYFGFVHQSGNLYPFLSVCENIALPLLMLGHTAAEAKAEAGRLADFLGIAALLGSKPATLSYGERQRTAIARALAHKPKVVFADEPTSALDPDSASTVVRLLSSAAVEFGTSLVMVSHDHALLAGAGIPAVSITAQPCPVVPIEENCENQKNQEAENTATVEPVESTGPARTVKTVKAAAVEQEKKERHVRFWSVPVHPQNINAQQADITPDVTSDCARSENHGKNGAAPIGTTGECSGQSATAAKAERPDTTASSESRLPLLAAFMAWRDFRHEWLLSFCAVLAFTAALCPLLLLSGIRYGVVETLSQRLINNPAALAITPYGSARYTPELLDELAQVPQVNFLVPCTRKLAATVSIVLPGENAVEGDLIPTAAGDPLLARYGTQVDEDSVFITRQMARLLPDIQVGGALTIKVTRLYKGRLSAVTCNKTLAGILPDSADWQKHVYAPLAFAEDVERYKDGFAVPEYDWPGNAETDLGNRTYAGFRMYVKKLDDVVTMRDYLMERNIETYTFAREVETLQSLKRVLSIITMVVGGVTLGGMLLSLGSLGVSSVRRKERVFAQTSLLGFRTKELFLFPVIQFFLCAVLAASLSLLFCLGAAALFDILCANWLQDGESVCIIPAGYVAGLYAVSCGVGLLCGLAAVKRLAALQPAEVLRRDT